MKTIIVRPYWGRPYKISLESRWAIIKYWIKYYTQLILTGMLFNGIIYLAFLIGTAHQVSAQQVDYVAVPVVAPVEEEAPVLARIGDCESGERLPNGRAVPGSKKQFNKDGSVVTHVNKDNSVDLGMYEINMTADHIKEMAKLGFNPMTEEGNYGYAKYLYENRGTGDWSASASCWKR